MLRGLVASAAPFGLHTGLAVLWLATLGITPAPGAETVASLVYPRPESMTGNGIDTASGAFTQQLDLLTIEGLFEISFSLSHNSLLTHAPGPVGYGWSHNFETRLHRLSAAEVEIRWDAVRTTLFKRPVSEPEPSGTYRSDTPDARHAVLIEADDGFRLTLVDGTAYRFDAGGRLLSVSNAAEQRIELGYDEPGRLNRILEPVTDIGLNLTYGTDGKVTRVSDDLGRFVSLTYDDRSRLVQIAGPSLETGDTAIASGLPRSIPSAASGEELVIAFVLTEVEGVAGAVQFTNLVIAHEQPQDLAVTLSAPSGKSRVVTGGEIMNGTLVLSGWSAGDFFEGELRRGSWRLSIKAGGSAPVGELQSATLSIAESARTMRFVYQEGEFPAAGRILGAYDSLEALVYACAYDAEGRIVSQDDGRAETAPATIRYASSGDRRITTYTSSLGFATRYEHDAGLRLLMIENALGHRIHHEYGESGNRTASIDARGHRVSLAYDMEGRLVSHTDEGGLRTDFEYHPGTRWIRRISDATGAQALFTYNRASMTAAARQSNVNELRMEYHPDQQLKRVVRNEYAKVDFYTDQRGRIATIGHPDAASSGADGSGATRTYDLAGRVIETNDYEGRPTRTRFTAFSEIARVTDPDDHSKQFDYDHRGRLIRTTDELGRSTRHVYDGNGNLVSTTDALGGTTALEYDADDRLSASVDPLGRRTRFQYDAVGQLLETIDPLGRVVRFEYDATGNLVARYHDDNLAEVRIEYDPRGLVTRVQDAYGNTSTAEYDLAGRKVRSTDASGYVREFAYDTADRLQFTRDSLKRRAFASYDSQRGGVPRSVEVVAYPYDEPNPPPPWETEGEALFLLYSYDYAGNLTEQDDGQVVYRYNRNNQLESVTVADLVNINLDYDSVGRLQHTKPQGIVPTPPGERDRQYQYDAAGRLTEVRSSGAGLGQYASATRRIYDELGRLRHFIDERGDVQRYEYDAVGNLIAHVRPDGRRVAYEYDAADRLVRVADWAGRVTRYHWDAADRVIRLELPNGVIRDLSYNDLGQLVLRTERNSAGDVLLSYQYQYDREGRIEAEIVHPPEPPPVSTTGNYTYSYDWNRLQSFQRNAYQSDFAGNITQAPGLGDLDYNLRGRLRSTDRYRYFHDEEDNLAGWGPQQNPNRRADFTLNPAGRLSHVIAKTESDGQATSRTDYVYGLGLLYEESDGEVLYYHHDYRGSLVAVSDQSGAVVGRVSYDPYGSVASRTGRTDTPFLFAGLYGCLTSPDEIVYMRFRWYSPQARQFLQRDAFVGNISDLAALNYFAYGSGDPVSRVDPEGEWWWIPAAVVIGAAVNVTATFVADLADDGRVNTSGARYGAAALGGAVGGFFIGVSGGLGGAVVGGAAGAATENLFYALFTGQAVDPESLALDTALGGAGGAIGYGAGKGATKIGGRIFGKYGNRFASNTVRGRIVNLFRPDRVVRRQGVRGMNQLVMRSAKTTAKQTAKRMVIQSGVRIFGQRVYADLFPGAGDFVSGGTSGGNDAGAGTTKVWIRHHQGGQPDKENRLGMYRLFGTYLDAIDASGQPLIRSPNYSLFAF